MTKSFHLLGHEAAKATNVRNDFVHAFSVVNHLCPSPPKDITVDRLDNTI